MTRAGTVPEVFLAFLRLGVTSFGGPIAHLGYFRDDLVARRRWMDDRAYADLVALCQFLPGPASSQVGFAMGLQRAGFWGAIAAFLGFTLPSAVLLVAFAAGASLFGGPVGGGILDGLKIVAVAIVAQAVWGMARSLTPDAPRAGIAVVAASLALFAPGAVGQLGALAIGVVAGLVLLRAAAEQPGESLPSFGVPRAVAIGCLVVAAAALVGLPLLAAITQSGLVALADAFFRSGALVFGGGHVVLPLLQAEVVQTGWVSPEAFLAGYGAAQAVPGPLFTFAAYLGAVSSVGPGGAVGATVALARSSFPASSCSSGSCRSGTRCALGPASVRRCGARTRPSSASSGRPVHPRVHHGGHRPRVVRARAHRLRSADEVPRSGVGRRDRRGDRRGDRRPPLTWRTVPEARMIGWRKNVRPGGWSSHSSSAGSCPSWTPRSSRSDCTGSAKTSAPMSRRCSGCRRSICWHWPWSSPSPDGCRPASGTGTPGSWHPGSSSRHPSCARRRAASASSSRSGRSRARARGSCSLSCRRCRCSARRARRWRAPWR